MSNSNSNFQFIRRNWLKGEFFTLLPDQPSDSPEEDSFKFFYQRSKPLSWFYLHGDLETLCGGTDLVRIVGRFDTEGICRQELYLPDNTSMDCLVFSWYTRSGMFRGLVVDPQDKQSVTYALNHMKSRSGVDAL